LVLTGTSSSYNAGVVISQGTLDLNSNLAVGNSSSVTLGDANTGASSPTLMVDSAITSPINLANIYTSSYGTAQTIVLNSGSALGPNINVLTGVLNLSGSVPLTIRATNTAGHTTRQDWTGRVVGNGVPAGSTALILDGSTASLRVTWANGTATLPANNFTGDVLMLGNVSTQGVTYLSTAGSNQNLGFLNNNVTVSSGATWIVVWGEETVEGLNGSGAINLNNQNAQNNIGLAVGNNGSSGTYSGTITGGFGLAKIGSGLEVFSGALNYSGSTSIAGGVMRLNTGTLPSGLVSLNGGVLELTSPSSLTRPLGSGAGQIQVTGGTSGFSANAVPVTVTLNNDPTSVVQWGGANFNPAALVLDAATADSPIEFQNPIDLNGAVRTVLVAANTATLSGALTSSSTAGGLIKTGAGTLVLSGNDTYRGGTTVNNGTLILPSSTTLADGTNLTVGNASLFHAAVVPSTEAPALAPVPEPSTLALLAAGALTAVWRMRRTKKSAETTTDRLKPSHLPITTNH
jgi:autotransporter-associated beta strand protein